MPRRIVHIVVIIRLLVFESNEIFIVHFFDHTAVDVFDKVTNLVFQTMYRTWMTTSSNEEFGEEFELENSLR